MKKRQKFILIAILMLLVSASVGGAYAYWAGSVNVPAQEDDTIAINIGEGKAINTVLTVNGDGGAADKVLVPEGQTANSETTAGTPVEEVTFTYKVTWDEVEGNAEGTTGTLAVTKSSVTIGENTDNAISNHVVVDIAPASPAVTIGEETTVTVKITLTGPANKADYDLIAGKEISVTLTFNVVLS